MLGHMRTTIILPEPLVAEAKRFATLRKRTLTSLIEESLRTTLARGKGPRSRRPVPRLPTFSGDGLRRGVNLDDSVALMDVMDAAD